MRIRLLLFGPAALAVGPIHDAFELPEGSLAGDVPGEARRRLGADVGGANAVALAVNRRYVKADRPLAEGDEVALIPPVSGG
jgi:molybdopterin converting factor small subunit